jgi:hypothetical protein
MTDRGGWKAGNADRKVGATEDADRKVGATKGDADRKVGATKGQEHDN